MKLAQDRHLVTFIF